MNHLAVEIHTFETQEQANLAALIDENMQAIGEHLPPAVKLSPLNNPLPLLEVPNVGRLEGLYIGNFAVRAQIISEDIEWYADFDLQHYGDVYAGKPIMREDSRTTPEVLLQDAPDPEKLLHIISTLRDYYTRPHTDH
jgi:hypothetical protein